jgi:hypothetical protein
MKRKTNALVDATVRLASAVFLILVAFAAARAQGPPPGMGRPEGPLGDPKRVEMEEQRRREAVLRGAEKRPAEEQMNKQRLMAGIEQTKQDFKRIQLVRKDMVEDLLAKKPLNFRQVYERAEEVNKRANRLKSYLMPPEPADAKKPEEKPSDYAEGEMTGALVKLCNTIYSFTENQMFKDLGTLDAQKSLKAGADLLSIIELSDNIKRSADKLAKAAK